jgi:hypothetical protein
VENPETEEIVSTEKTKEFPVPLAIGLVKELSTFLSYYPPTTIGFVVDWYRLHRYLILENYRQFGREVSAPRNEARPGHALNPTSEAVDEFSPMLSPFQNQDLNSLRSTRV